MRDIAGREHPSLPQHATPDQQEDRARAVGSARKKYTWTTQVATLPGVPLATSVPFADEPNVPWLLKTGEVALAVAKNALANKAEDGAPPSGEHEETLRAAHESLRAIGDLHDGHEASALGRLAEAALASIGNALGSHTDTLQGHLDALKALVQQNAIDRRIAADVKDFEALFKTLPLPEVASNFQDDATFAWMRVAGPNAGMIEGISTLPGRFPVTDAQFRSVMGPTDSLARAGSEGRLYLQDYASLGGMVPGVAEGKQKYLACAFVLFAVPVGGRDLVPVAIQCGQDPAKYAVHVRPGADATDAERWTWEMAKFACQVADGNYHELFAHLARTHLVQEAFGVAMHRNLAPEHPLFVLLVPHFEGTLFINNAAAGSLIAEGGPIDHIFAGTIETIQLAAAKDRLAFDFTARMLPNDLRRRNVERLPDYPYRDDARLVWNAIHAWVAEYVGVYYGDDGDVVGDTELAAFCADVRGAGAMRGFPVIETRAQLVDALTMIVFTGSVQHAAVNFPQQPDMTFAPNVTGAAWAAGPDGVPATNAAYTAMLPPLDLALEQLNTLWLLGGVHYRKLGDYLGHDFPYSPWFKDERITRDGGPLEGFRNRLREVEAKIEKANAERPRPYTFLIPKNIPESINI